MNLCEGGNQWGNIGFRIDGFDLASKKARVKDCAFFAVNQADSRILKTQWIVTNQL